MSRSPLRSLLAGLALAGLAIAFLGSQFDLGAVGARAVRADPMAVVGIVVATLAFIAVKAWRWHVLLGRPAQLDRGTLLRGVCLGSAANYAVPHIGELVRAEVASRRCGLGRARLVASIAVERVGDVAVIAALALLTGLGSSGGTLFASAMMALGVAAGSGILLIILMTRAPRPLTRFAIATVSPLGGQWQRRIHRVAFGVRRGLRPLLRPGALGTVLALSGLQWGCMLACIGLALGSVGLRMGFTDVSAVLVLSTVGLLLPSAPGYAGTTQLAFLWALQPLGYDGDGSLAASVVYNVIVVGTVLGAAAWGLLGRAYAGTPTSRAGVALLLLTGASLSPVQWPGVASATAADAPRADLPGESPGPARLPGVIHVATVGELQEAVSTMRSGTTILIAPGDYPLTRTLSVHGPLENVAIRGATGRREDVVLRGAGRDVATIPHGIWAGGDLRNLHIADLTVRDVYYHAIVLNPGPRAPRISNVHLLNSGQQLLKTNPNAVGTGIADGIIERSLFEYIPRSRDWYANAIEVLAGRDWIIRDNLIRGIRAPSGQMAGPAILAWFSASGTVVERNTFVNCQREIAFGLIERTPDDHSGGTIRNNLIYRDVSVENGDVAIGVFDSPGTLVHDNTILLRDGYPNAIEYRWPGTRGVVIERNRSNRGIVARDGASATLRGNEPQEALRPADEARLRALGVAVAWPSL